MPYIKEDKKKGIEEQYIPDWLDEIVDTKFDPFPVAWINSPKINQDISIET